MSNKDDCISRQAAIDALEEIMADHPLDGYEDELSLINAIKNLPPAQPETAKRIVGKSRYGMPFWYQCDMCNEPVNLEDSFCSGCGRRLTDG